MWLAKCETTDSSKIGARFVASANSCDVNIPAMPYFNTNVMCRVGKRCAQLTLTTLSLLQPPQGVSERGGKKQECQPFLWPERCSG